jgi:NAD(P)-dependent dehydrogenase (short-subunit alcohol dehydrogenase family)
MVRNVGVVTGAGGDIGAAVCEALGQRGLAVLCVDLDEKAADPGCRSLHQVWRSGPGNRGKRDIRAASRTA